MTNQKLKDDIYDALKTACMYAPDLFALIVEDANQYHVLPDLPQTENLEFLTESPWQSYVFSKLTTYILGALEDGDLHYATTTGDEFEIALSTDTDYNISITTKRIHYSVERFFGQFDEDINTLSEEELAFEDVVAQTVDRNDLHETQQTTLRNYCKRLSHELDLDVQPFDFQTARIRVYVAGFNFHEDFIVPNYDSHNDLIKAIRSREKHYRGEPISPTHIS